MNIRFFDLFVIISEIPLHSGAVPFSMPTDLLSRISERQHCSETLPQ